LTAVAAAAAIAVAAGPLLGLAGPGILVGAAAQLAGAGETQPDRAARHQPAPVAARRPGRQRGAGAARAAGRGVGAAAVSAGDRTEGAVDGVGQFMDEQPVRETAVGELHLLQGEPDAV